jgi:hypothetical protein
MIERVMLLDAVLDEPTSTWLGPAPDKRRHFIRHLESRLDAREYPHLTFGDGPEKTVRFFPDKRAGCFHRDGCAVETAARVQACHWRRRAG